MKPGHVYRTFTAKDGRLVTLWTPRWEDLDDLLALINGLIKEGADIARDQPVPRAQEAEWLGRVLTAIETDQSIRVVAEVDGRVVASAAVTREKGYSLHVGKVGIGISQAYRDRGIGTAMLDTLIAESQAAGLWMLWLEVFATNHRARHIYAKVGFTETGIKPKMFFRNGRYIDSVIMTMDLTKLR